jgi:DNA-directed RNA polymerase specialized sigma24 family protein
MATATKKGTKLTAPIPLHRILREVLRHYIEYRDLVNSDGRLHVLEYGYWVYNEDGTKKNKENVTISFWDLHNGLKELAPRKREAIYYNVIRDMKQKDVAAIMGITTVSVGQYVEAGTIQLAKKYFPEAENAL